MLLVLFFFFFNDTATTEIYTGLVKAGLPTWIAAYGDEASVDIIDKLVTVLVAIFIYQGLPRRYRSLFRMYEPADSEGEERAPARAYRVARGLSLYVEGRSPLHLAHPFT